MRDVVARDYETGRWTRLIIEGNRIVERAEIGGPGPIDESDEWVAPAFWDIQINGRGGVSFSDPGLTVDQVAEVIRAQAALGTARLCPTLITAPPEAMEHGVRTIAAACRRFPDVAARVVGIHLEGPSISEVDGYRGAHPREAVRGPDWAEFERLQSASGGRVVLVTLAPERPGALDFIRRASRSGVVIALGHTAAGGPELAEAIQAGARLSTHLGNGIAAQLARHPNPIWVQAASDALMASLIADGHHLDRDTLRVLLRAKGPRRIILVSDASPLAGLSPGRHGAWEVDPSGKIVVAGTPYLAGSNRGLDFGLGHLLGLHELTLAEAVGTVAANPARLLGKPEPTLTPGEPANLVVFRRGGEAGKFGLRRTCVDGQWSGS